MKNKGVRYYDSYTDDFVQSSNQNYDLPDNYRWIRTDFKSRFLSGLIYGLAIIFGGLYCRLCLHLKIKGKNKIKGISEGFFVYGNHTQPIGDVFTPAICMLPKRIYTVVSQSNYGIPFIGKLLPYLGALPIAKSLHGAKEFNAAVECRIANGHPVVIFPEAHVWEYYTDIRPFPDTSFKFPIKFNKPSFSMTVTYRKSKIFKRPVMTAFIDGPFYADGNSLKEKSENLRNQIFDAMRIRSAESNFNYIEYIKK